MNKQIQKMAEQNRQVERAVNDATPRLVAAMKECAAAVQEFAQAAESALRDSE